jgi:hypothetical protein
MAEQHPMDVDWLDGLSGSPAAKKRLRVILEHLAGQCSVEEASAILEVTPAQFEQMCLTAGAAMVARMEDE